MHLSVIIPVLNDTAALRELLALLKDAPRPPEEIIVVDGARQPQCAAICADSGVRYIASPPGRGHQLRIGAEAATGEALWFLHADTRPDPAAAQAIRTCLQGNTVGGCCQFRFAGKRRAGHRIFETITNWRARVGVPYGDQGIFCSRTGYASAGGFADEPLFEEVPLVRGLRRLGRFKILPLPIAVSPRRWEEQGWLRRSLGNRLLAVAYMLGVPPGTLARHYRPMEREDLN